MSRAQRQAFERKRDFSYCADLPDLPFFTAAPRPPMIALNDIPNSSNLAAAGYCSVSRIFAARFHSGKVYHHRDVPEDVAQAFETAESKGSFYARQIKPNHAGELVVDAEQSQ